MLQTIIFKKAKHLYHSGLIQKKGEGKKEYYSVYDDESKKEHQVEIEVTKAGLTIECVCTQQSLHQPKRVLCSHIIGVINKKYFETQIKK